MKVTPVSRKFGKYAPGDVFELKDKTAKLLIKVGKLREPGLVEAAPEVEERFTVESLNYATRMLTAAETSGTLHPVAPYGYKTDGTPRLRPGRPAKSE